MSFYWHNYRALTLWGDPSLKIRFNPVTSVEYTNDVQPYNFELSQNFPNPFNPSTKISWQSPVNSWQTLKIYDLLGNEITTLVDEYRKAGRYEVEFNASKLSSGIYFYKLNAGSFTETKKMVLLR
ncbi:MAG: T9SS type A sorting domain-containing protein [Ignavibacterium sp.]